MITPTQFDTTPITAQITRLIATGSTADSILAAVAHMFPELSPAELSAALQDATAAAERKASAPVSSPSLKRSRRARKVQAAPTAIRDADDLDEATKRLAAIERALEALQRRRRRWSTLAPSAQKELR